MGRMRTSATELARLLDAVDRPVYALDEDHRLIFCNQACADWLDRPAGDLLGKQCVYQGGGEATGVEAVLAGLCPPPSAWTDDATRAIVACTASDGRLLRRCARFLPLCDAKEQVVGLLAVGGAADVPESEAMATAAEDGEAAVWHERLRNWRLQAAGRHHVNRLVGDSPAMYRVRAQVALAAASRASVLIVGPPGSGRQRVAGAIHYAAPQAVGRLVPLACSILGAELIDSTIVALATKTPLKVDAGQGTLLLNDADQLPLEVQKDLAARFSNETFPLRVIATARQPLEELARQGKYRSDLAAVLGTLVIELPALAQRRADLPILAQWFLEEINARGEKQVGGFTSEAMDRLDAYPWPGNLDELAAAVAESHQCTEGTEISVGDLPERLHLAAGAAAHPRQAETAIVLDEFLARVELELIRRALARAKGNKTKAAKLLGMTRPRLYRRLEQLGLLDETKP